MIDEKKLIEELETLKAKTIIFKSDLIFNDAIKTVIKKVNEQPKLNEWIPVEKELPKNNQEIIVTFVNHKPPLYYQEMKDVPISSFAVYYNRKWYWWNPIICDLLDEYGICDSETIDKDIEIIAWMPLPKPYGGNEND